MLLLIILHAVTSLSLSLFLSINSMFYFCSCLFWQYPLVSAGDLTPGSWGTGMCQPQSHFVLLENYITCTCQQLGDFAAANEIGVGYGWTFPAAITAGLVMTAVVLVVLVHLCYLSRTQLATKILINLCIGVGVFQLMLFISILAGDSPSISADGCAALGGLLQFTVIVQFVWILALVSLKQLLHCISVYPFSAFYVYVIIDIISRSLRLFLSGSISWASQMVESH